MAIIAKNSGSAPREVIPAGNYVARCYQMLHCGHVDENILGDIKHLDKVLIGFELPTETKVFNPEKGEQPLVISKFFTLSLHEKAALRIALKSWRSKDFTEAEAEAFDIEKLVGVPCMINIVHKPSKKDASVVYEEIAGITPVPKGMVCPPQVNATQILSYDKFDNAIFESLPDFLKEKIKSSDEYTSMMAGKGQKADFTQGTGADTPQEPEDDLPF